MSFQQISTGQPKSAPVDSNGVETIVDISPAQDDYVAYVALGGLIPDPEGKATAINMTADQFASRIGVERTTLYYWRKSIPNFWDRVNAKRREIGSKDRLSLVWNGIFLKAAAGGAEQAKLYLANFDPDFRMPMQKHEHDVGDSLAEMMNLARQREAQRGNVIEGETIDAPKPE